MQSQAQCRWSIVRETRCASTSRLSRRPKCSDREAPHQNLLRSPLPKTEPRRSAEVHLSPENHAYGCSQPPPTHCHSRLINVPRSGRGRGDAGNAEIENALWLRVCGVRCTASREAPLPPPGRDEVARVGFAQMLACFLLQFCFRSVYVVVNKVRNYRTVLKPATAYPRGSWRYKHSSAMAEAGVAVGNTPSHRAHTHW